MKTFAIIGVAGYIAPRHMKAIKEVGGQLIAALDPHDSVGILDSYFPECLYFMETERFDRWLSKNQVDYVSIMSPNYLHDSHCLMAMRNGADVICEKPLTCNEHNLDNLLEWEEKTGKKVNVILQCRLHPEVFPAKYYSLPAFVKIDYQTPRGQWYLQSWKGDVEKSGGLITNIGIHLFDLCEFLFGKWQSFEIYGHSRVEVSGSVIYDFANVEFRLSIKQGERKRIFKINQDNINLTNGFDDLHTETYRRILDGNGFGIEDIRSATRITEAIRNACENPR